MKIYKPTSKKEKHFSLVIDFQGDMILTKKKSPNFPDKSLIKNMNLQLLKGNSKKRKFEIIKAVIKWLDS